MTTTNTAALGSITKNPATVSTSRIRRFHLQTVVPRLLQDRRQAQCLRHIAPHRAGQGVEVRYSPERRNARYGNLYICGKLWICPVCAARITEQRRQELSQALARAKDKYRTLLVTYTLRHHQGDCLDDLLNGLTGASAFLRTTRAWREFKRAYGWVGSVRSLEVTHNPKNGWHVHIHELVLLDKAQPNYAVPHFEAELGSMWKRALHKKGADATQEQGVHVEEADERIRDYVAKYGHDPVDNGWTLEHDLTKTPAIISTRKGRTPFQLLEDYDNGDKQAGALFIEYAKAFKGRHQLEWSGGLRKLLGMGKEQTDQQLASAPFSANEVILATLTHDQWRIILQKQLRAQLLDVAATGDENKLGDWLVSNGVDFKQRVNATDFMWAEYDRTTHQRAA